MLSPFAPLVSAGRARPRTRECKRGMVAAAGGLVMAEVKKFPVTAQVFGPDNGIGTSLCARSLSRTGRLAAAFR